MNSTQFGNYDPGDTSGGGSAYSGGDMGSMGNGYNQYGGSGGNDDYTDDNFNQNETDPYGSEAGDTYNDSSAINGAPPGSGAVTKQPLFPHPEGFRGRVSNLTSYVGGSGMSGGSSGNQMGDMDGMNETGGEQPMGDDE
jgi:hypothetical protein